MNKPFIQQKPNVIQALNKFESLQKTNPALKKTSVSAEEVITEDIVYIQNGEYESYTFAMTNDGSDNLRNLVLVKNQYDNSYSNYLVTYQNLSQEEIQQIVLGLGFDSNGKVSVETVNTNFQNSVNRSIACGYVTETIWETCSWGEHGEWNTHEWNNCQAITDGIGTPPRVYTKVSFLCDFVGDIGGGGSGTPIGGINSVTNIPGQGGGGNDSGSNNNGSTPDDNGNSNGDNNSTPVDNISDPSIITLPNLSLPTRIGIDSSLQNTQIKCILEKMAGGNIMTNTIVLPTNAANDNFFQQMLRRFNGTTAPNLTFRYDANLPEGVLDRTRSFDGGETYEIICGIELENLPNIIKMTTLAHELTHAYMLNDLMKYGLIEWPNNGSGLPKISSDAQDICEQNDYFSNNYEEYTAALLCLYIENPGGQDTQWNHQLFGMDAFDMDSYVEMLTNYVKNNYDWNSESSDWKTVQQTQFGNDWKNMVSLYLQMDGLRKTTHFSEWTNLNPDFFHTSIIVQIIENGNLPQSNITAPANKTCN